MNLASGLSVLRTGGAFLLGNLAAIGLMTATQSGDVTTALSQIAEGTKLLWAGGSTIITVGAAIWGARTHTTSGVIAAAEVIPGIKQIVVDPVAHPVLAAAAADISRPVVVAVGSAEADFARHLLPPNLRG